MPRRQNVLCPRACPTMRESPMAKPNQAGIIIRVSGVRVPPPASRKAPYMRGFFASWRAAAAVLSGLCVGSDDARPPRGLELDRPSRYLRRPHAEAGRPVVRLPRDLHYGRRAACSSHPGRQPRPRDLHGPERATPAVTAGAQEACARRVPLAGRERLEQPSAPARVAHPPSRGHVDHSARCRRRGAFLTVRHPAPAAAQQP